MIASLRGLIALSVIAAVLGAIVVVDRGGGGGPTIDDRRLVPGLVAARVLSIELGGGPDGTIRIEHDRDGGAWRVTAPSAGPADAAAVADLLGAIAAARWERRAPVDDAPPMQTHRTLVLAIDGGARTTITFGDEVAGAEQTWARVDRGPALLVPSWVATAAERGLAAWRITQLVRARPDELTGVELHGHGVDLVVSGATPVVHTDGGTARVRVDAMARLTSALAALRATAFPAAAPAGDVTLTLRAIGGAATDELTARGACPARPSDTIVEGSAGVACASTAQLDAVVAAARAIPTAIDPAPLAKKPVASLAWKTGVTITANGGGFAMPDGKAADDDAVHAAIDALTAPATAVVPLPATTKSTPALDVTYADGTIDSIERVGASSIRRRGEPFALTVDAAALRALAATADDLRDRALITEEPSALAALDVTAGARHARAARGASIADWSGDLDGAAVLAAAETIAHLRALRFAADRDVGPIALTITATFAAPPVAGAKPTTHTIELGARCAARVDHVAALLDADRCATLRALAPR